MTKTNLTGVRISDRHIETVTIRGGDTVTSLQEAIDCRWFDVVSLGHGIDLFVDDEGAINGSTLNLPATIIAHTLGVPAALFGTAVALGSDDASGESLSLNDEQTQLIVHALARRPDPDTVERLCETLSPLPQVVDLIRSL
jgi:Domain of unknown function (DUF3846)